MRNLGRVLAQKCGVGVLLPLGMLGLLGTSCSTTVKGRDSSEDVQGDGGTDMGGSRSTGGNGDSGDGSGGKGAGGREDPEGPESGGADQGSGGDAEPDTPSTTADCEEGTERSCGDPPLSKLGACAEDTAVCQDGKWVGCTDEKGQDSCDLGNDNDCDGMPNEDCPCIDGEEQECGNAAVGICVRGLTTCIDSKWGPCEGEIGPEPRDCSSPSDNDCDGLPDNTVDDICRCPVGGMAQSCDTHPGLDGNGPCKAGSQVCELSGDKQSSDWGECMGAVGPASKDTCEPENDADCNGTPNEECPCVEGETQNCGHAAVGICLPGTATCTDGEWVCSGGVNPKSRDCSSPADNDCDGKPDNTLDDVCKCIVGGSPQSCGTHPGLDGNGPCKAGTRSCDLAADKKSSNWGTCTGSVGPKGPDSCEQGNDNDCDGTPNEGCSCVNGQSVPCVCGPPATCVNGAATSCTVGKVTLFQDADLDGFGNPSKPASVCPAEGGYASNAEDCDDGNKDVKPGYATCSSDLQRRWCPSGNNGVFKSENCSQGCFGGACRDDGTIGVPGMITCPTESGSPIACTATGGCCSSPSLNGNTCGTSGKACGGGALLCDGPNDCGSGQACYLRSDRAGNYSQCETSSAGKTGLVCDPLAPSCATCTPYSTDLNFIYTCK